MKISPMDMSQQLQMLKGIRSVPGMGESLGVTPTDGTKKTSFMEMLSNKISEVNNLGLESDRAIQRSLTGESDNPQDTVLAIQKAAISFELMLNIKQRIEQAYQELIRTHVG